MEGCNGRAGLVHALLIQSASCISIFQLSIPAISSLWFHNLNIVINYESAHKVIFLVLLLTSLKIQIFTSHFILKHPQSTFFPWGTTQQNTTKFNRGRYSSNLGFTANYNDLLSSFSVRDKASHLYKTTDKLIFQTVLSLWVWRCTVYRGFGGKYCLHLWSRGLR